MEKRQENQEDEGESLPGPPETIDLQGLIEMGRLDADDVRKIVVVEEYCFSIWRLLENVVAGVLGGVITAACLFWMQNLSSS